MVDQIESMIIGPKSFSGGRNVEWSKDMSVQEGGGGVLPDQLIQLDNFDVSAMGALTGRKGTIARSNQINEGARIHSVYFYYKTTTSTLYVLVHSGTKAYKVNFTTGIPTLLTSGLSTIPLRWLTWNDNAYAFNGTGIYKFDGTNWTQIQDSDADCPDSTDGCVLEDVLFTAQDSAYKSRVPYSDEFDAEAWTSTNFRRVRENDGQEIIGMDVIGNRIFCRRSNSSLYLHGSSIYDFAEEFLTEEIGQIGRMTGAVKKGTIFFQSNRGIEFFAPGTPELFNNIARDTCMSEISTYTRTVREAACGVYHPKTDRYYLSYPDASTPIIYVFYTNIPRVTQDNNIWFPHAVYKGITVTAMAVDDTPGSEGKLYFGTSDGYLLEANYGYNDSGTEFNGTAQWGYTHCDMPTTMKNFSRVFMPARANGSLQVVVDVDFGRRTKAKFTPSYTPENALLWGAGNWGEKVWTPENIGTKTTRYLKCNGVRIAVQIQKKISDEIEIHPFTIEFFPKEKVKWQ